MSTNSKVFFLLFSGAVNSWMLIVEQNRFSLQIGLSISRIGMLVIKLLAFLVTLFLISGRVPKARLFY